MKHFIGGWCLYRVLTKWKVGDLDSYLLAAMAGLAAWGILP